MVILSVREVAMKLRQALIYLILDGKVSTSALKFIYISPPFIYIYISPPLEGNWGPSKKIFSLILYILVKLSPHGPVLSILCNLFFKLNANMA